MDGGAELNDMASELIAIIAATSEDCQVSSAHTLEIVSIAFLLVYFVFFAEIVTNKAQTLIHKL